MSQPAAMHAQPQKQRVEPHPPPPRANIEAGAATPEPNFHGASKAEKWKREDWIKKGALVLILRATTLLLSFLCFILMVTVTDFPNYPDLCYVFSVGLFVVIYTTIFVGIKAHELRTRELVIPHEVAIWIDFIGDQFMALLLLSAASAGASAVSGLTQYYGAFTATNSAAASVGMAFLAFFCMEPAALISSYVFYTHLSKSKS